MDHLIHHNKKDETVVAQQEPQKHGHLKEAVPLGAGAAGIAYEHQHVKTDPEHKGRHHAEEALVGATAGGVALHEHRKNHPK
jgi:hypothetical protein